MSSVRVGTIVSQAIAIVRYLWKKHWLPIAMGALVVILFLPWLGSQEGWWSWSTWEPTLTIATLVVAVLVWWGEVVESWEAALQKRLWVQFVYNKQMVMAIENMPLMGEWDIRSSAQQMGRQLNKNQDLKVGLCEMINPPKVIRRDRAFVRVYEVRFILSDIPNIIAQHSNQEGKSDAVLVWRLREGEPVTTFEEGYQWCPPTST